MRWSANSLSGLLRPQREANAPVTFRQIAHSYLDWLTRVKGAKPATLRDHRYLLAEPGAAHRRGSGAHRGMIMAALGDRPAAEVETREINSLLEQVADSDASNRTVNKHRQLICAIYGYASQDATFGLANNPAARADRRPEPERARLDFYRPHEIEQLAAALEAGAHRDPQPPRSAQRSSQRVRRKIARTPTLYVLPRTPGYGAGSSLRSGGATSTSTVARLSLGGPSARTSKRPRPNHGEHAKSRSLTKRRMPLCDSPLVTTSPRATTTSSPTDWVGGSMARRSVAGLSEHATPRVCGRFDSTIFGTPMDRCSSPAASTSHLSSQRWATPGSPRLSATCMLGRRAN